MEGRGGQSGAGSAVVGGIGRQAEDQSGLQSVLPLTHPPPAPPETIATVISSFAGTFPTTLHDQPHSAVTSLKSADQGGGDGGSNRHSASGTNRHSASSTGYGGISKEGDGVGLVPLPTLAEGVDEGVDHSGRYYQPSLLTHTQLSAGEAQKQQASQTQQGQDLSTQRTLEEDDALFRQMREKQQRWQREADESALRAATTATAALLDTVTAEERRLQQETRHARKSQLEEVALLPNLPLPPVLAPSPAKSLPALIPLR